jgi:hypothetical protein
MASGGGLWAREKASSPRSRMVSWPGFMHEKRRGSQCPRPHQHHRQHPGPSRCWKRFWTPGSNPLQFHALGPTRKWTACLRRAIPSVQALVGDRIGSRVAAKNESRLDRDRNSAAIHSIFCVLFRAAPSVWVEAAGGQSRRAHQNRSRIMQTTCSETGNKAACCDPTGCCVPTTCCAQACCRAPADCCTSPGCCTPTCCCVPPQPKAN